MSSTPQPDKAPSGTIAWMARNSIAANLIMLILVVGGLWTFFSIQKEVFPEFQLDVVEVNVSYPGAAPVEVEQGILRPVEEATQGVEGIREVTAEAREGRGTVSLELVSGVDRMQVFQDVDQAVSRITTFPDDIEQPVVSLQTRQREVMEVVLYGEVDHWNLRKLGERLRDQLQANERISKVDLGRAPDYVTHVEIPLSTLRAYGLTLEEVATIIRQSSEDIPAGSIETGAGEILLRMDARRQLAPEFATIEVITAQQGRGVLLGDIATITDGFEGSRFHSQFNQQPSIEVNVFRVGEQSPLDIAEAVEAEMAIFEGQLPPGVTWRIDSNAAEDFRQRVSLVSYNAIMAVFIVMGILALFLELRLAFWVMAGMVISFIGGVVFLPMLGVSINMISLFGFLIVLGIVVDDAIVVGENVYEHRLNSENAMQAAVNGAREMARPVTFSILSNIVAFIPIMMIPGETGQFWEPLPIVVIVVLLVSLYEALYILPAHLAHSRVNVHRSSLGKRIHEKQQRFSKGLNDFVQRYFKGVLDRVLAYRYVVLAVALALFAVSGTYLTSNHMGMIMMPEVPADEIEAGVRLPVGTTPDQAAEIAHVVTAASLRMFDKYALQSTAQGIKTNVRGGARFVDVEIVMLPPEEREMTVNEVIELWREEIGDLPGVTQITFEAESGPGGWRQDISIDLAHDDIAVLEKATQDLMALAESFENSRDVNDNFNKGKEQFNVRLLPQGRAMGLTAAEVGAQLRGAFFGDLALRMIRGTNEVEVRVKLPEEDRKKLHTLESMIIRTPRGDEVPLLEVVAISTDEAFSSITRRNGNRVVNVSFDVEPKRTVGQVVDALRSTDLPELQAKYPGLIWSFEGSDAEMREATQTLWLGFGFALVVIYGFLAVAFGSYFQPLVVLVAIPFGMVGAVFGHMVMGFDFSLISLMGVIALSGIVVNDSLIMVDHANRYREELGAYKAIHAAGLRRFRPIILTTLTTSAGLSPLMFETSLQAQYIVPMAISLGFGVLFATCIILVLVPCLYLILEDILAIRPAAAEPKK